MELIWILGSCFILLFMIFIIYFFSDSLMLRVDQRHHALFKQESAKHQEFYQLSYKKNLKRSSVKANNPGEAIRNLEGLLLRADKEAEEDFEYWLQSKGFLPRKKRIKLIIMKEDFFWIFKEHIGGFLCFCFIPLKIIRPFVGFPVRILKFVFAPLAFINNFRSFILHIKKLFIFIFTCAALYLSIFETYTLFFTIILTMPIPVFWGYARFHQNKFENACRVTGLTNSKNETPELLFSSFLKEDELKIRLNGLSRIDFNDETKLERLQAALNIEIVEVREDPENRENIILGIDHEQLPHNIDFSLECIENSSKDEVSLYLGKVAGKSHFFTPIGHAPHIALCGMTGMGKSVALRCQIFNMLYHYRNKIEIYGCDFKAKIELGGPFTPYFSKIVDNVEEAKNLLNYLYDELERRLQLLASVDAKSLDNYNSKSQCELKRIIVIIDEMADLYEEFSRIEKSELKQGMSSLQKLRSITKRARCVGINMIFCTQRVDSKSIDGSILGQCGIKISLWQSSISSSILILNSGAAFNLPPIKGRAIIAGAGANHLYTQFPFIHPDQLDSLLRNYCPVIPKQQKSRQTSSVQSLPKQQKQNSSNNEQVGEAMNDLPKSIEVSTKNYSQKNCDSNNKPQSTTESILEEDWWD